MHLFPSIDYVPTANPLSTDSTFLSLAFPYHLNQMRCLIKSLLTIGFLADLIIYTICQE